MLHVRFGLLVTIKRKCHKEGAPPLGKVSGCQPQDIRAWLAVTALSVTVHTLQA